jgi:hypothetical protein
MIYWYFDEDADGYGGSSLAVVACTSEGSLVANSDDCDDNNDSIFPGADEYCNEIDDDCDDETDEDPVDPDTFYVDTDEDGFGTDSSTATACDVPTGFAESDDDCDDTDADISPGGTEVCDEVDNDCDDDVDEDVLVTFYQDVDGDGYADSEGPSMDGCEADVGYTETVGDCDDSDADIYPDADEYCNGIDDDCDDEVDEAGAVDGSTYYRDADDDGYGDPTDSTGGCDTLVGYVTDDTDCDDTESSVYPGAVELCDDLDNDCNDAIDDGASETWYADNDEDGYGTDDTTYEGCDPPAGYVDTGGDCDDDDLFLSPGEPEICDGIDNNCDSEIDEDSAVLGAAPDCAASVCNDIDTARSGMTDGTFFFTDGVDIFADECDFDNPPTVPEWSSDIRPMITSNCVSCHSSSGPAAGLNLQALPYYNLVNEPSTQAAGLDLVEPDSASLSYVWHKLMDTHMLVDGSGDSMPKSGFMPPDDIQKWTDWINAGANP